MKITKISISGYRSCVSTTFEPHPELSVLIGPNGSGKTTVLSAIRLLPAIVGHRNRALPEALDVPPTRIKTWLEIDGKEVVHTARLNLVNNERNQDEIISVDEAWYMYDLTGKKSRISIPSWLVLDMVREEKSGQPSSIRRMSGLTTYLEERGLDSKGVEKLGQLIRFMSQISYYGASQFTNPASAPISFEVEGENMRRVGISITGHKKFLFDLYQEHRRKSDSYKEFIALVGPEGIGLIEDVKFDEITTSSSKYNVMAGGKVEKNERQNLLVVPSFAIAGNQLSPSQLSEGTFKTLALIFHLVTDVSPILLIEEPEVCVHLGLLSSIVELIRIYAKNKQIVISTHSDAVLDRVAIENVFTVARDPNLGTQVSSIKRRLKAFELQTLRNYLENEGSLGEYWKHGDLENA